jgi:hypothetical protein
MNMTLPEKISLDTIRDQLRFMAKSEGGIGLDEGMINFDHISELIYFQLNQNNGVIRSQGGSQTGNHQTNLVVDHHMNHMIHLLK